ncbi:hypothetical protein [Rhizobium sp. YS-1r]|uniref:hypothetical protein n=1 Tax=Rhizobium sp. YS-1r TaxID=1532558 RepID=UPI00050DCA4A|nr:hypothetical protein [Rhizobium sp. YS-1r]KGE02476.1 hypothetical protein JL39_02830 [Rhizobium sp. YS-1r]
MWGEILTAGASIIGSLFGKKSQKTKTSIDLTELVNQANGNGFNPLTVLRNGGAAGFTTTTSPTVSQLPEALGSLGGVLGGALDKKLDPIQAKKRELDTALVDLQLRDTKEALRLPAGFYSPRTYTGTKVSQQLVPRLGAASHKQTASVPAAYVPQNPNLKAGDDPEASDVGMNTGRYGWFDPGWLPDAGGAISNAYGEPGEWIGGAAKGVTAAGYSLWRNARSAWEDYSAAYKREKSRSAKPPKLPPYRPGGWVGGTINRRARQTIRPQGGGW